MALIECPKCGNQISDKAVICPKCGENFESKEEYTESPQSEMKQKPGNQKGKIWVVLGAICVLVLIVFFLFQKGINTESSTKKEKSVKSAAESLENGVESGKEEESAGIDKSESEEKSSGEEAEKNEVAPGLQEIQMGETVEVHTIYGNIKLTIDAIRKSDWIQRAGDTSGTTFAALLEMDIENIDFEDPYNGHFFFNPFLGVYDEKNYVVQASGTGYEDGQYAMVLQVPKGTRAKIVIPYVVSSDTQSISININNEYAFRSAISE